MAAEGGVGEAVPMNYTALIVDDMPLIRNIAEMFLRVRGFVTLCVENGKEAVDLFAAGNEFHVVFIDLEMPVMNGIQATKEMRAMGVKSPIIGVTSTTDEKLIREFKEAGLDECIEKPLTDAKMAKVFDLLNN